MKESASKQRVHLVLAAVALTLGGCTPAPPPVEKLDVASVQTLQDFREDPRYNKVEPLNHHVVLPPSWDNRSEAPERLVGHYIALLPDKGAPTGHRMVILGEALNPQGVRSVALKKAAMERYDGRVDGTFASTLSFVPGRVEIRKDHLYDLRVAEDRAFQITAQGEFLDRKKVVKAWSRLPKRYRDVFFVSAAASTTITAREYAPSALSAGGPFAVKLGETFYQEGTAPRTSQALYLTLVPEGDLFGEFDDRSGLYTKKGSADKINLKKRGKNGAIVSFQTLQVVRKTLAASGLQQSK